MALLLTPFARAYCCRRRRRDTENRVRRRKIKVLLQMIAYIFRKINDNLCFNVQESLKAKTRNFPTFSAVKTLYFSLLPRRNSMYWKLLVVNSPGIQQTTILSFILSEFILWQRQNDNSHLTFFFSFLFLNLILFDFCQNQ
jgi:hypothetical protein